MKIRAIGFKMGCEGPVGFDDVFQEVQSSNLKKMKIRNKDYVYVMDEDDHYYFGMIVITKDHRKLLQLIERSGSFENGVLEADDNKPWADFNFFAISKRSLHGLYLHYHGSLSDKAFMKIFDRNFNSLNKKARKEALDAVPSDQDKEDIKRQKDDIKTKFKSYQFGYTLLLQSDDYLTMASRLKKITEASISYTQFDTRASDDMIEKYLKSKSESFRFTDDAPVDSVVKMCGKKIDKVRAKSARLSGVDQHDREQVYKMIDNLFDYGTFSQSDYDDLLTPGNVDFDNVNKSQFIEKLCIIMQDHPMVF